MVKRGEATYIGTSQISTGNKNVRVKFFVHAVVNDGFDASRPTQSIDMRVGWIGKE